MTYLDSNIVIYLVEQPPVFGARAFAAIQSLLGSNERLAISDLHRFECRYGPIVRSDQLLGRLFNQFFASPGITVLSLGAAVLERACEVAAKHSIRPLDSIHLAAAIEGGCQSFLTNDRRLRAFTGIRVDLLP